MTDAELLFERAGESRADEVFESFASQHYFHPFPTCHLANSGMNHVDELAVEPAANILNAFARDQDRPFKQANKIGTLSRQCKSDRNHFGARSRSRGGRRIADPDLENAS